MDRDYVSFAILLAVFGIVGITGTANASPNIFASQTCNCIPSPLARVQELSLTLLAFAIILTPVAITRKTASTSVAAPSPIEVGSGRTYSTPPMKSGEFFALGIALVVVGLAVVAPSFLVLGNFVLLAEGVAIVALGLVLAYRGSRASL